MRRLLACFVLLLFAFALARLGKDFWRPSPAWAARLPLSYPLLRAWAQRAHTVDGGIALDILAEAGYDEVVKPILWRANPDPYEWRRSLELLRATPADVALAAPYLDTDRPADRQWTAQFLRSADRGVLLEYARGIRDPRRALLVLSLIADYEVVSSGELSWSQGTTPVPQAQALYRRRWAELRLPAWPYEQEYPWKRLDELEKGRCSPAEALLALSLRAQLDLVSSSPERFEGCRLGAPLAQRMELERFARGGPKPSAGLTEELYTFSACRPDDLLGLAVSQARPHSRYTTGCRAYARIRGGTYFGDYSLRSGVPGSPAAWREWLAAYPDHPGADDALYWLGRCLEHQGRRREALRLFLDHLGHVPGDRDMEWRWQDHCLWLLDVGCTAEDLASYLRYRPDFAPARYALALRHARRHRYAEALRLTEGLALDPYSSLLLEWFDHDWSLAQPHLPQSAIHRAGATFSDDLAYQRGLWRQCASLRGYQLARLWSESGGWRVGYCLLLRGSRVHRWRYSWDGYLGDLKYRPDGEMLRREARAANQNEVVAELVCAIPGAQARYTRLAAYAAQALSSASSETEALGRDYLAAVRQEARLLLRDYPDCSMADDVFAVFHEMTSDARFARALERLFPDSDRLP